MECVQACQLSDSCKWHSFQTIDNSCHLTADCHVLKKDCDGCVTSEKSCDLADFTAGTTGSTAKPDIVTKQAEISTAAPEITTTFTEASPTTTYLTTTTITNETTSDHQVLMVVGGNYPESDIKFPPTEIIDLRDESSNCKDLAPFNFSQIGTYGTFIQDRALLCGEKNAYSPLFLRKGCIVQNC